MWKCMLLYVFNHFRKIYKYFEWILMLTYLFDWWCETLDGWKNHFESILKKIKDQNKFFKI